MLFNGFGVVGKGLNFGFNYVVVGFYCCFVYVCVGINGFVLGCLLVGLQVVIGEGQVCILQGYNGVVFFLIKFCVQGDLNDGGGSVFLFLKIDGQQVGSFGIQQLGFKLDLVSICIIFVSYLSVGLFVLGMGCYIVQVVVQVLGDFCYMLFNVDMLLVWFD